MARRAAESPVSEWTHGRLSYRIAGPEDDAELRAMVAAQSMPGWVNLSFEREPDFFAAAAIEGERHAVIAVRDNSHAGPLVADKGDLAGMYSRAVRRSYINGVPQWLGYLGQLRVAPGYRGGYHRLRHGFEAARRLLEQADEMPFNLTSIVADNHVAKRLLTARLPGMPRYRALSEFVTLVLPVARKPRRGGSGLGIRRATARDLPAIVSLLQSRYREFQFAPVWEQNNLRTIGLDAGDFWLADTHGSPHACLALWDQSHARQTVVRGYKPLLARARGFYNLASPITGLPRLPPIGSRLRQAWLSHIACAPDDTETLVDLIRAALDQAARMGEQQLLLGFCADNPLLNIVRKRFRCLRYLSRLYLVHWPNDPDTARLDGRPIHVEAACL